MTQDDEVVVTWKDDEEENSFQNAAAAAAPNSSSSQPMETTEMLESSKVTVSWRDVDNNKGKKSKRPRLDNSVSSPTQPAASNSVSALIHTLINDNKRGGALTPPANNPRHSPLGDIMTQPLDASSRVKGGAYAFIASGIAATPPIPPSFLNDHLPDGSLEPVKQQPQQPLNDDDFVLTEEQLRELDQIEEKHWAVRFF